MSFLNPLALFLLAGVPVLVLLYFLKLKRPQVRVPSTLLWQKVIEDMRVNSPFQKLRRSLLLLLQLLALLAAIFALARPLMLVRETVDQSAIVLIDTSASMSAVEADGRTRLEQAKADALKIASSLSSEDEMMLVSFNARASVVCGFTGNKRQLKETINSIKPTQCPTTIEPAMILAKSIANSRKHPRIFILSDGAFETPQVSDIPGQIEYHRIGTNQPNIAVTGLDIRRSISDNTKVEMFVALENFSQKAISGSMAVYLDDKILDSKVVSVGPLETLSQIFEAVLPEGGNISVKCDMPDALAIDNQAWKIAPPPRSKRVLVVGDNNFFVERAFKSSSGVICKTVTHEEYEATDLRDISTVIWNAATKPAIAPCNNIYLGCFPEIAGFKAGAAVNSPGILDWENSHPLNRFLDYDNLLISSSSKLTLPEGATVMLRSTHTPLIALWDGSQGSVCVTGFDPTKSNWPLLLSFPLFLNNCLEYFSEKQAHRIENNIQAGRTITMPPSQALPVIIAPDGRKHEMARSAAGGFTFAGVEQCGIYRVTLPENAGVSIAANLFDRRESLLDTTESLVIGSKTVKTTSIDKQVNREYWRYLVIAFLVVLLVEWFVYHRRIFV